MILFIYLPSISSKKPGEYAVFVIYIEVSTTSCPFFEQWSYQLPNTSLHSSEGLNYSWASKHLLICQIERRVKEKFSYLSF